MYLRCPHGSTAAQGDQYSPDEMPAGPSLEGVSADTKSLRSTWDLYSRASCLTAAPHPENEAGVAARATALLQTEQLGTLGQTGSKRLLNAGFPLTG